MELQNLFHSLTLILLLTACTKEPVPAMETKPDIDQSLISYYENFNANGFKTEINNMLNNGLCEIITIGEKTKLYNITGWVLSETKPSTIVYLTPIRNVSHRCAMKTIRNCHPILKSKIIDDKFTINHVPPGIYVIYIPIKSYIKNWGPPLPHTFNLNYEINISSHGGDSQYMASVFELKSK